MSLFRELKRRNVFRVAAIYLASSWLVLQATDVLISLTGLPPFAGFIAKYYLLAALLETQSSLFYAVALAAVLNSAISLYFYARVVKAMYLEKPEEGERPVPRLGPASATVLAAFVAPTLVLGVWWTPLVETIRKMSTILR